MSLTNICLVIDWITFYFSYVWLNMNIELFVKILFLCLFQFKWKFAYLLENWKTLSSFFLRGSFNFFSLTPPICYVILVESNERIFRDKMKSLMEFKYFEESEMKKVFSTSPWKFFTQFFCCWRIKRQSQWNEIIKILLRS